MALLVLKMLSAHFLVQFTFQRRDWSKGKPGEAFRFGHTLAAAGIYWALGSFLVLFSAPSLRDDAVSMMLFVLCLAIIRFALDALSSRFLPRSWFSFLLVQTVQVAAVIAYIHGPNNSLYRVVDLFNSPKVYGLVVTYALSLGFGSVLVRLVTASLSKAHDPGIAGAGNVIGILERLLVTSLMIYWPQADAAAIGLIFSAKSIARFPELGKQDGTQFAEYYLVGSLTSFTVAIAAGLLARYYLPRM